jgi:hypothetical protein
MRNIIARRGKFAEENIMFRRISSMTDDVPGSISSSRDDIMMIFHQL